MKVSKIQRLLVVFLLLIALPHTLSKDEKNIKQTKEKKSKSSTKSSPKGGAQQPQQQRPPQGFSPEEAGMTRDKNSKVSLTEQVRIFLYDATFKFL